MRVGLRVRGTDLTKLATRDIGLLVEVSMTTLASAAEEPTECRAEYRPLDVLLADALAQSQSK